MAKIELPEGLAGVGEPLRALIAEMEREAQSGYATAPDPTEPARRGGPRRGRKGDSE